MPGSFFVDIPEAFEFGSSVDVVENDCAVNRCLTKYDLRRRARHGNTIDST